MYADYIYLDIISEEGTLENNVKITDTSAVTGTVNTTANEAKFDNKGKRIYLKGDVSSYRGKTSLVADEGVYDIEKNELTGEGDVNFQKINA